MSAGGKPARGQCFSTPPKGVLGTCVFTWLYHFLSWPFDLNGEANRVRKKKSGAIVAADGRVGRCLARGSLGVRGRGMKFGIGQPMRRHEDLRLITGQGRYTDDVILPGMTHAFVLRSPVAHAH